MTQPSSSPPHNELLGQSIMAVVGAMKAFEDRAMKLLAEHGIDPLLKDTWYPLDAVLAAFRAILVQIGPNTMKGVGRHIPDHAQFPERIDSIESALRAIDVAYRMNHRGPGGIGGYRFEALGPRGAKMVCDNPYPCPMDEGLIEAMAERYRPKDSFFVQIVHEPQKCRERGDPACTYTVAW